MKNKIFSIILSIVLSLPITVWAVDDADIESTNLEQPLTVSQLEEDADSIEYKQPVSKRRIAKKFLAAMGGVAVSSFSIFFLLSIYNRIRSRYTDIKTPEGEVSLETPDNLTDAVKIFLDKTRW